MSSFYMQIERRKKFIKTLYKFYTLEDLTQDELNNLVLERNNLVKENNHLKKQKNEALKYIRLYNSIELRYRDSETVNKLNIIKKILNNRLGDKDVKK